MIWRCDQSSTRQSYVLPSLIQMPANLSRNQTQDRIDARRLAGLASPQPARVAVIRLCEFQAKSSIRNFLRMPGECPAQRRIAPSMYRESAEWLPFLVSTEADTLFNEEFSRW